MSIVIRDVREHELDSVLALNNAAGPAILPLDAAKLRCFCDHAEYFRVAETRRHARRLPDRRGVQAARARQQQLPLVPRALPGLLLHRPHRGRQPPSRRRRRPRVLCRRAELSPKCATRSWPAKCSSKARNDPALLFHGSFGFREVGQHVMPEPGIRAAMLMKELCSYPWVRETYGDALPDAAVAAAPRSAPAPRAARAPTRYRRMSGGHADYEQAGELKIGQVGIANLRVRTLDVARLAAEMRDRVQRAPKLFERAAVVARFRRPERRRPTSTDRARAGRRPARRRRAAGRARLRHQRDRARWREQLGLPLLAKFRAHTSASTATQRRPRRPPPPRGSRDRSPRRRGRQPAPAAPRRDARPDAVHAGALGPAGLRARTATSPCCATVGAGAEVIADGSIHIYGALRGRALAGAQGNEQARIFCREFHAELVADRRALQGARRHPEGTARQGRAGLARETSNCKHRGAATDAAHRTGGDRTWPKSS